MLQQIAWQFSLVLMALVAFGFATMVIAAVLVFVPRLLLRLETATRDHQRAPLAIGAIEASSVDGANRAAGSIS
jgi:hypothetical protein